MRTDDLPFLEIAGTPVQVEMSLALLGEHCMVSENKNPKNCILIHQLNSNLQNNGWYK